MSITIEVVSDLESLKIANRIAQYGFEDTPSETSFVKRMERSKYRSENLQLILKESGNPLATSSVYPLTQNLRDRIIPCGGVAVIATLPEGRRKGYVTTLMKEMFKRMKEMKQTVSVLHPFKESYYYKYGYTSLQKRRYIEFNPNNLKKIFDMKITGNFEVHKADSVIDQLYNYMQTIQQRRPGMIMFTRKKFEEIKDQPHWIVFAKYKSDIVGALLYRISMKDSKFIGKNFYYTTEMGKYILLKFIAVHIDQVDKVFLETHPNDFILSTMMDIDVSIDLDMGAMVRVIDIKGLKGTPVGAGKINLKVSDQYCSWNDGTWKFESSDGKLKIEKTNEPSLSTVDIHGLNSILYGIHRLEELDIVSYGYIHPEDKPIIGEMFPKKNHFVSKFF